MLETNCDLMPALCWLMTEPAPHHTSAQVQCSIIALGIDNRPRIVAALCGASSEHKPAHFAGDAARKDRSLADISEWVEIVVGVIVCAVGSLFPTRGPSWRSLERCG
jgi:hypothetical protein